MNLPFFFYTWFFTVYLTGFLGISQSFCLTSNCKFAQTPRKNWALSNILFLTWALNLLDFPQIYLLFIDIFINMLFILSGLFYFFYNTEIQCFTYDILYLIMWKYICIWMKIKRRSIQSCDDFMLWFSNLKKNIAYQYLLQHWRHFCNNYDVYESIRDLEDVVYACGIILFAAN